MEIIQIKFEITLKTCNFVISHQTPGLKGESNNGGDYTFWNFPVSHNIDLIIYIHVFCIVKFKSINNMLSILTQMCFWLYRIYVHINFVLQVKNKTP